MNYDTSAPKRFPEPGYYYHYKHDPAGPINGYAYFICGTGHHTEDDCRPQDANMLVYRPLYDAYVYKNGKMFDLRPLEMFFEPVVWQGREVERFTKITDKEVLAQLRATHKEMYPEFWSFFS